MSDKQPQKNKRKTPPAPAPSPSLHEQSMIFMDLKKIRLAEEITREQIHTLDSIESFLTEYLDDFIVVGHAINGQRVNITHAKTPRDMDSLEQFYTDNLIMLKNKKLKNLD